jgi:hypothetical protein
MSEVRSAARSGKYQKVRLIIASAIERLPYAEALDFVRLVKINQGAQELALLPADALWQFDGPDVPAFTTADIVTYVSALENDFTISWPSVSFHWGIMITVVGTTGARQNIRTTDYALTETYLCS